MIEGNRLIFGYGSIGVTSDAVYGLIFEHIKPPQELGTLLHRKTIEVLDSRHLYIKPEDVPTFKILLENSEINRVFEFGGLTFDFTNWSQKSVDAVLDRLDKLTHMFLYILPYAC